MHLSFKAINIILNIFLGVAWAATFYFFLVGIFSTNANYLIKFINGFLHSLIGLFLVIIIEMIFLYFKKYEEQKITNKLLKELLKRECD